MLPERAAGDDDGDRQRHEGQRQAVVEAALDAEHVAQPPGQRLLRRLPGDDGPGEHRVGRCQAGPDEYRQRQREPEEQSRRAGHGDAHRHDDEEEHGDGAGHRPQLGGREAQRGLHDRQRHDEPAPLEQGEVADVVGDRDETQRERTEDCADGESEEGLAQRQVAHLAAGQGEHDGERADQGVREVQ